MVRLSVIEIFRRSFAMFAPMFSREIKPSCSYCSHGTSLGYDEYFCVNRGIMNSAGSCGRYRYEPTKRIPPPLPQLQDAKFTEEDFKL